MALLRMRNHARSLDDAGDVVEAIFFHFRQARFMGRYSFFCFSVFGAVFVKGRANFMVVAGKNACLLIVV